MLNIKHTPAPWHIEYSRKEILISSPSWGAFIKCYRHPIIPPEQSEANATLVSIAPELLQSLAEILEDMGVDLTKPEGYSRKVQNAINLVKIMTV
jgi:hypothetical protein